MKSKILITLLLLISIATQAQSLELKSGKIYQNGKKLSNSEVKKLLEPTPELLESYQAARNKSAIGGFLLGFGIGSITADVIGGLTIDRVYPGAMTYLGLVATLVSIPVLIGRDKKTSNAIEGYNKTIIGKKTTFQIDKVSIITNGNGVRIALGF